MTQEEVHDLIDTIADEIMDMANGESVVPGLVKKMLVAEGIFTRETYRLTIEILSGYGQTVVALKPGYRGFKQ